MMDVPRTDQKARDACTRWEIMNAVLQLSGDVRYVALYADGTLGTLARAADDASAAESDRYEELLVNPTLMLLTRQRGDIDCGGMSYVVVRYGGFFQLVMPWRSGHASVALELAADPIAWQPIISRTLRASW